MRTHYECIKLLEDIRWPEGPYCPRCPQKYNITVRSRNVYRCNGCRKEFTIRTLTIMSNSHMEACTWLRAMTLFSESRKLIPALTLSVYIHVTPSTGHFIIERFHKACKYKTPTTLDQMINIILNFNPKEQDNDKT